MNCQCVAVHHTVLLGGPSAGGHVRFSGTAKALHDTSNCGAASHWHTHLDREVRERSRNPLKYEVISPLFCFGTVEVDYEIVAGKFTLRHTMWGVRLVLWTWGWVCNGREGLDGGDRKDNGEATNLDRWDEGSRFNIWTVLPGVGIPIKEIRRSPECLIFMMGIPKQVRR